MPENCRNDSPETWEEKVSNLMEQWFSNQGILSLGHRYLWKPELLWAYAASDVIIGLACYSISTSLIYFVYRRGNVRFHRMYVMFALVIFAGGTSHLSTLTTVWTPINGLDLAIKALTAIVSAATAVMLLPVVPKMLLQPSAAQLRKVIAQLEHEVAERRNMEEALRQSQETLRELAAYQERIREDERKRIAREIHDELGQNLLVLRLDVSALHARAGTRHPLLRERSAAALEYIDTTMKSIRNIMNNLRPSVLDLGLSAAIEWQVRQFEQRNGIACELVMDEEGLVLQEAQATAIFRILQESLTNVGRHAQANRVRIELGVAHGRLTLTIEDNGVGMYPGDRRKPRSFGLVGIQERVKMLSGELNIDSCVGKGTVLRLSVPLRDPAQQPEPFDA
ncbi:MAG TPA: sensor histidine kinase [Noviherbaspirillum sp.]|uniref:sensor histidine kinase n=1 Tax=Noviherbaspirillum sp. TaxID=1926288 RepID=UPI002B46C6CD|nr:sensor histidine kinase [Noviherbaspirillum sp.]HJV86128.1 sensor histidine kinase [Noviherbaspirillum sp.]